MKQIQPPKLSKDCEQVRRQPQAAPSLPWETTLSVEKKPKKPTVAAAPKVAPEPAPAPEPAAPAIALALANKQVLPQWDCAPNVDFVTISLNGFKRKLTGGEICNPYEDVVREVPASAQQLPPRLHDQHAVACSSFPTTRKVNGKTIAWAISGRDVCRNNPDPDCFAATRRRPAAAGRIFLRRGARSDA